MKTTPRLRSAVDQYVRDLAQLRASGGATGERSGYPPPVKLLDAVGGSLKPKVLCVSELVDQGAGHPDIGLYSAKQVQRGRPRPGQVPERGVVEVKGDREDLEGCGTWANCAWLDPMRPESKRTTEQEAAVRGSAKRIDD